jgi:predicted CoA-binding protein
MRTVKIVFDDGHPPAPVTLVFCSSKSVFYVHHAGSRAYFLSCKRIVVAEVSCSKESAANLIYRKLRPEGYEVFAVNPNTNQVEGDICYCNLTTIQEKPEGVVIVTRSEVTIQVVMECVELGIASVWMENLNGSLSKEVGISKRLFKMTNSKKIAGLIGPSIVVISLSETVNASIWAGNIAPAIHLNGSLLFIAGLAIVRSHNLWIRSWPLLVTLVGWFIILLGLFRMFAPGLFLKSVQSSGYAFVMPTMGILAIGIYLTFKAYSRHNNNTDIL